ncbi:2-oxoacid:acceptor oxidoreductase subunit alpha [Alkaliphilus serpentinus]|uniref:2-oxoacid:acceptor oxidoreductase subunit alpha n=1 Tax=Alkaliphilus serpentinus TaxID=1482731 RepID=A0A833HRR4_9FIRM|nr:2-oxoacid:acceptor oxidoreductase subunit alpha [Alkaliphilus serpentinus]KAB3533446.1 2-oxoacid:acceptor oxidoreductase subunit alpha [Alkaliphilus serpentinus]
MVNNITILMGGIQGEGVVSAGINLMKTLSKLGYYTYGCRSFSSRIKGGNNTITLHASTEKILCIPDKSDIIIAFDDETIPQNIDKLKEDGLILYDSTLKDDGYKDYKSTPLPMTEIAKTAGSTIMKNTCGMAFIGRILGIDRLIFEESIKEKYAKKADSIITQNLKALELVYNHSIDIQMDHLILTGGDGFSRPLMIGNEAIALGALMAECRFMAAYPITPASEIMEYLGNLLPRYGGVMMQVEDEIAAVNMVIGASYAGTRAITATSGPGLSLMQEGIGLASMTETPLVIVDSQRVGPSTGLPTKHEQSDLYSLYYGGHGEYPSIILAPASVEDCYYDTIRAFNLADEYQCPVIILSDLSLSLSPQTIDPLTYNEDIINRGKLMDKGRENFEAFSFTEDGISQRVLPGTVGGEHHVTGLEHNQLGLPSNDSVNRRKMMDKRFKKIQPLESLQEVCLTKNHKESVLLLTFGSNYGIVKEAVELAGNKYDYGYIKVIKPLPKDQLKDLLDTYKKVIIIENNFHGQLAKIIIGQLGYKDKISSIHKYDGSPFTPFEILEELGGLI